MPGVVGSGGPAVRSKDNRWCRGIRGPGPPLQICLACREVRVDLAGDVTLEDAHDFAGRATFGGAAGDVFAGAFIAAHPGEHDPPERMVGLAVPAGVESMKGWILPDDACRGATPQRCANAASL